MNLSDGCCFYWMKYKGSLVFFPKDQFVKKANQIFLLGFCEEIVGAWTNLEDEDSQKLWRRGFCMRMRTSTKSFFSTVPTSSLSTPKKSSLDELSTYCILQIYENAGCVYALQIILRHLPFFAGYFTLAYFLLVCYCNRLSSILLYGANIKNENCGSLAIFMPFFAEILICKKTPMRDDNSPNDQGYGWKSNNDSYQKLFT